MVMNVLPPEVGGVRPGAALRGGHGGAGLLGAAGLPLPPRRHPALLAREGESHSHVSRYAHNNDTTQSQYVEGAISRGELVSSMEEVWRHLELVTRVWGGYRWGDMMMT